jgi:hypothetical protein
VDVHGKAPLQKVDCRIMSYFSLSVNVVTRLAPLLFPTVAQPPQDRPADARATANADGAAVEDAANRTALIVARIVPLHPNRTRMGPCQQLGRAQHPLPRRQEGAPHSDLHATATKCRLGGPEFQIRRLRHIGPLEWRGVARSPIICATRARVTG